MSVLHEALCAPLAGMLMRFCDMPVALVPGGTAFDQPDARHVGVTFNSHQETYIIVSVHKEWLGKILTEYVGLQAPFDPASEKDMAMEIGNVLAGQCHDVCRAGIKPDRIGPPLLLDAADAAELWSSTAEENRFLIKSGDKNIGALVVHFPAGFSRW